MENSYDCNILKRLQQSSLSSYFHGVSNTATQHIVSQSYQAQITWCCFSVTDIFAQLPQYGGYVQIV